jgi:hypothetical protein
VQLVLVVVVPASLAVLAVAIGGLRERSVGATAALGVATFVGIYVVAYLSASSGPAHPSCEDCQRHLGRYWDPPYVTLLAILGVIGVAMGAFVGTALLAVVGGVSTILVRLGRTRSKR